MVALVRWARHDGVRLRVLGSGHSVPAAIAGANDRIVMLDGMRHLRYDPASGDVTVGAGARLGPDPLDPARHASEGLCPWLHARGRALSNLGGILHQTVAGFLATGSGGGSPCHDAAAAVVGVRVVDGRGDVHQFRRGHEDEWINAVLVSVGTCGIITEVTLRTEPGYDVVGSETVLPDRSETLDLFADDRCGLASFLSAHEYARLLWWPQRGVQRVQVWEARRAAPGDTTPKRAYQPMPTILGSSQPMQLAGGAALWGLVHWRRLGRMMPPGPWQRLQRAVAPFEAMLYRAFVDGDPARPQRFRGAWWEVLPQDATMDERWMPTTFTEIFVPLEEAGAAMRTLDALFAADPAQAGHFAIELYAAPASSSWLHPAYARASLRINVFWLMHAPDDPRDRFFPRIWEALAPFTPRLHWGKLFPHHPASTVTGRYPRLGDFETVRRRLDPDRVFLTPWLAVALGVDAAGTPPPAPLPSGRRALLRGRGRR